MNDMVNKIEQPKIKTGRHAMSPFRAGTPRAAARLKQLAFDPIEELVKKYHEIEKEIARQERIRDGELIELTASGRERKYMYDIHMSLYDKLMTISDKLLRYGYGRVPEVVKFEEKKPTPLIVNLTKKGETFVINETDISDADVDNMVDDMVERDYD